MAEISQTDIDKFVDFAFDIRKRMLKEDKKIAGQLDKKFKNLRSKINKFIKSNQSSKNPLNLDRALELIKVELDKIDNFLRISVPKAQAIIPKNLQNAASNSILKLVQPNQLGLNIKNFDIFKPNTKAANLFKQEFFSSKTSLGLQGFYDRFHKNELPIIKDKIYNSFFSGAGWQSVKTDLKKALKLSEFRAQTIARTEINEAYRKTTKKAYQALNIKNFIWLSARDQRTCAICWGLHGQRFDNNEFTIAHPNCRCTLVASVRGADKNIRAPENRFNNLPKHTQRLILGRSRYEKYKNNKKVKLKSFVTSHFHRGIRQFRLKPLKQKNRNFRFFCLTL
jgi:SPP1 gp7 family putative phage head morphogenesis protein